MQTETLVSALWLTRFSGSMSRDYGTPSVTLLNSGHELRADAKFSSDLVLTFYSVIDRSQYSPVSRVNSVNIGLDAIKDRNCSVHLIALHVNELAAGAEQLSDVNGVADF